MAQRLEPLWRFRDGAGGLDSARQDAVELALGALAADACCLCLRPGGAGPIEIPAFAGDRGACARTETGPFGPSIARAVDDGEAFLGSAEDGCCAAAPLVPERAGAGALVAWRGAPFDGDELALLRICAARAASTIGRARDREAWAEENRRLEARLHRFELIRRVGMTLIEGDGLEESMQKVVDMVATTLDYSQTAVLLLDPDLEELDLVSAYGYGEVTGLRIPLSQGATGYAARHAEPVNIRDVRSDPRYVKGTSRGRSELAVPIMMRGEVIGVLDVESPTPGAFGEDDVETLTVVASYAAAGIQLARLGRASGEREGKT
jgi:GAF domain-containing protein